MTRWSYVAFALGVSGITTAAAGCSDNAAKPQSDASSGDDSADTSLGDAAPESAAEAETVDAAPEATPEAAPVYDAGSCMLDLASPLPCDLKNAGLYSVFPTSSDLSSGTIDPKNVFMAPAYVLWSDGAEKRRWIFLPPGTKIDVTDMNEWVFPVGTKLFKEFDVIVNGVPTRVETRLLMKTPAPADGGNCTSPPIGGQAQGIGGCWNRVAYKWSPDGKSAQAIPAGEFPVAGTADGDAGSSGAGNAPYAGYSIPSQNDCEFCHGGRKDGVLGVEALDLAGPAGIFDWPGATGPTGWEKLQSAGLVMSTKTTAASVSNTNPNGDNHMLPASKLQVPGNNAVENAAVSYLHANCGMTCHNSNGKSMTNQFLRLEWDPVTQSFGPMSNTPVWKTAINKETTGFRPYDPDSGAPLGAAAGTFYRLLVNDPTGARSMIYYRPGHRNAYQRDSTGKEILTGADEQMPKIDSHKVDTAGRKKILDWLGYMSPDAGYPVPPSADGGTD